MFTKDWTMCLKFVKSFQGNNAHNWGNLRDLMAHHHWTLINYNNSRLAPNARYATLLFRNSQDSKRRRPGMSTWHDLQVLDTPSTRLFEVHLVNKSQCKLLDEDKDIEYT